MNCDELFDHYRKTASTAIPRDAKFLEGMFLIRRNRTSPRATCGTITKAATSRQQIQVRGMSDDKGLEWVAWAALLDDCILFHSTGDMFAVYSALARNWQHEGAAAQKVAA